jgi:hypothetical protein
MNFYGRLLGAVPAIFSVCLLSAPSFAQTPNWPKQNQIDLAPFEAVVETLFGSLGGNQGSPDPSLQKCEMSKARSALVAGLTPQGTRQINPAVNTPDAANGLTTSVRSIDILSTASGCAKLDSAAYLAAAADDQRAAFSAQHVQQPIFIRARFSTGSVNKKGLRADHAMVVQHVPTGLPDYPWVVRTWNHYAWKGTKAAYGIAYWPPMIGITLIFQSVPGNIEVHKVELIETYVDANQSVSPALSLALYWEKEGHAYYRFWNAGLVNSYRDETQHGMNFSGINTTDFSFELDCYVDNEKQDYYRVINTYDCVSVKESEFGEEGVFRSSQLIRLAAEAEASERLATVARTGAPGGSSGAAECVKAYAAAKACDNMPSDPFGVARGLCTSAVKSKFGGSGCRLPF